MALPSDEVIYRFRTDSDILGTVWVDPVQRTFRAKADPSFKSLGWQPVEGRFGQLTYLPKGEDHTTEALVIDALKAHTIAGAEPWFVQQLAIPNLASGQYHPRVYRQRSGPEARKIYGRAYTDNVVAFENLQGRLNDLFRIVEPNPGNDSAFGHAFRELLILACTEVELLWRQLLEANHYGGSTTPRRLNTTDYVKTKDVLFLEAWEVSLENYPDYPRIAPFKGWDPARASQSLDFFDSYNAVKHSRDTEFGRASFKNAITAVAAVHVLLGAEFGFRLSDFSHLEDGPRTFRWSYTPDFPLEEQYIPPGRRAGWTPTDRLF